MMSERHMSQRSASPTSLAHHHSGEVITMTTKTAQFTPVCTCQAVREYYDTGIGGMFEDKVKLCPFHTAAPAMYDALKALHSVLDQRMPDGRTLNQHLSREVFECFYGPAIAARAAIAKAEGA